MLSTRVALHGESTGIVSRLGDNTEAGYGRSYVSDPKGPAWLVYLADSHWPNFYWFRCPTVEEALEHAEIVLCPVDDETEALAAADPDNADRYAYEADGSLCADGRIRTTWALRVNEWV